MANDETTDIKWLKELFSEMRESQKDLREEMRTGFKEISDRLDMYQENFETKEHAEKRRKKILQEVNRLEKQKADRKAVENVREDLQAVQDLKNKVIWLVISIVITAVVYTVVIKPF